MIDPIETSEFVTIPNVVLCTVGEWNVAGGQSEPGFATFSMDDVAAAVEAQHDPGFVSARLKIGHTDPRFDGEPAMGTITNLRASSDGMSLIGDIVGIPAWLATIMPTAYPTRSIEATRNMKSYTTGREYSMVLTGLALLGVQAPAVTTLDDLRARFAPEPSDIEIVAGDSGIVKNREEDSMKKKSLVTAAVNIEDVRRAFYEAFEEEHPWWWCRTILLDPSELIVDDDQGGLYRVPFSVSGNDVSFGEPSEVRIEYVDVANSDNENESEPVAASNRSVIVFASRSESIRPVKSNKQEETKMELSTILDRLGLAEDATEEAVLARIDELEGESPESNDAADSDEDEDTAEVEEPEAVAASMPEGTTLIDTDQLAELQKQAAMGVAAREKQIKDERESIVSAAVADHRIAPARKDYWLSYLEKDFEGGKTFLDSLAAGSIPAGEIGNSVEASAEDDSYPSHWFGNRVKNGQKEG